MRKINLTASEAADAVAKYGSASAAAKALGVSRATLRRRMAELQADPIVQRQEKHGKDADGKTAGNSAEDHEMMATRECTGSQCPEVKPIGIAEPEAVKNLSYPGKTVYLTDTENVSGTALFEILKRDNPDLVRFYFTEKSQRLPFDAVAWVAGNAEKCQFFKCKNGSPNALDFQIITDLGYAIAKDPESRFVVVTDDAGFDPAVQFWKERGISVSRRRTNMPEIEAAVAVKNGISPTKPRRKATSEHVFSCRIGPLIKLHRIQAGKIGKFSPYLYQCAVKGEVPSQEVLAKIVGNDSAEKIISIFGVIKPLAFDAIDELAA